MDSMQELVASLPSTVPIPPASHLPPEILSEIFSFLDLDKTSFPLRLATLRRCCLVSRTFLPFARKSLYRELYARSTGNGETDCAGIVESLRKNENLRGLTKVVHCLHLSFEQMQGKAIGELREVLELCGNLQHLILFGFGRDELPELMPSIISHCPSLLRLEIDSRHRRPFEGKPCLVALQSLPHLEGLSLLGARYEMEEGTTISHPGFKQLMLPPLGSSIFNTLASASLETLETVTFTLEMGAMTAIDFGPFISLKNIRLTLSSDMKANMEELYLICEYLGTCTTLEDLRVGATYPKAWLSVDLNSFITGLPRDIKKLDVSSFQLPCKVLENAIKGGRYRNLGRLEYEVAGWKQVEEERVRVLLDEKGIMGVKSNKMW